MLYYIALVLIKYSVFSLYTFIVKEFTFFNNTKNTKNPRNNGPLSAKKIHKFQGGSISRGFDQMIFAMVQFQGGNFQQ